jgi:hypothetical protein
MSYKNDTTITLENVEFPELKFELRTDIYEGISINKQDSEISNLFGKKRYKLLPIEKKIRKHIIQNPEIREAIREREYLKSLGGKFNLYGPLYDSNYKCVFFEVKSQLVTPSDEKPCDVFLGHINFFNANYDESFTQRDLENVFISYLDRLPAHATNKIGRVNPIHSLNENKLEYVSSIFFDFVNKNYPGFYKILPVICKEIIQKTKVKNPEFVGLEGLITKTKF